MKKRHEGKYDYMVGNLIQNSVSKRIGVVTGVRWCFYRDYRGITPAWYATVYWLSGRGEKISKFCHLSSYAKTAGILTEIGKPDEK